MDDVKKDGKIDSTRRHLEKSPDGTRKPGMGNVDWTRFNRSTEDKHKKFPTRPPVSEKDSKNNRTTKNKRK